MSSARGTRETPDVLPDLLREQRRIVEQLADLAASQSRHITEAQTDGLLRLLAARQELIDRFTRLQPEIARRLDAAEGAMHDFDPEIRAGMRDDIAAISSRLEQVMAVDAEDQRRLESLRKDVSEERSSVDRGRAVRSAYRVPDSAAARFTDRKG